MVLVFFTASYWFFSLAGSKLFGFVEPLAESISEFIKLFYQRDTEINGMQIDVSLLLFDLIAIGFVLLISKCKFYIYRGIENLDFMTLVYKRRLEKLMNEELHRETEEMVKQYNNAAIIIEFDAKDMHADSIWGSDSSKTPKDRINESMQQFYLSAKTMKGCTFAKTENKFIIITNFDRADNLLFSIEQILNEIKKDLMKKHWSLITYLAVDTYYSNKDLKKDVYPILESLLSLKFKNEIVCYGNFNLRYNMSDGEKHYEIVKKGDYDINGISRLYSLVKKS